MIDYLKTHWRKVAIFAAGALAGGLLAIGHPEAAAVVKAILTALGGQ